MKKITIAVILVLFVALLVVLGRHNGSSSNSGSNSNGQPVFSVTSGNTTYYGAMSSDVGVAVLGVQSQPYLFSFGSVDRPDGKFVLLSVAITNHQHDAITMNTSLFEIVDPSGNVYSASEKSMDLGPDRSLFLAEINPGITKTGEVVFDIPVNLSLDDLRLRFRGGMTGDTAELPLKVNSTIVQASAPLPQPEQVDPASETPNETASNVQGGQAESAGESKPQDISPDETPGTTGALGSLCAHNSFFYPQDVQDSEKFIGSLQLALRTNNSAALPGLVDLPLQVNKRINDSVSRSTFDDPEDLRVDNIELFSPEVKSRILGLGPTSCLTKGKGGFTMGDGTAWFHRSNDGQFKLFALNQQ